LDNAENYGNGNDDNQHFWIPVDYHTRPHADTTTRTYDLQKSSLVESDTQTLRSQSTMSAQDAPGSRPHCRLGFCRFRPTSWIHQLQQRWMMDDQ
jgi:hypothetical protein